MNDCKHERFQLYLHYAGAGLWYNVCIDCGLINNLAYSNKGFWIKYKDLEEPILKG